MRDLQVMLVMLTATLTVMGCGGGRSPAESGVPEGASSPEQAVEVFLQAAQEGTQARERGELGTADRAYTRMAAVFGTEAGSIRRSRSSEEVRNRMIVLSACLRPGAFRIASSGDIQSRGEGRTVVTVELRRGGETSTLPFRTVRGREDRWFIEQIELGSFTC